MRRDSETHFSVTSSQEVEELLFSLIYFSVGEHAWLQVDLCILPYKEDFWQSALGSDEGRGGAST